MTFNATEISNYDGHPVALYEFAYQTLAWRYTSADRDITFDGHTWLSIAISDSGIKQGSSDEMTVTLPVDLPVVDLYRGTPPSGEVTITIRRMHFTDTDHDGTICWVGTIAERQQTSDSTAVLTGHTLTPSFTRGGLRLSWDRNCPHFLYGTGCGVDKEAFRVDTAVTILDVLSLAPTTTGAYTLDDFLGGMVQWDVGSGTIETRFIESVTDTALVLMGGSGGIDDGSTVAIYPGCNRTINRCNDFFNNALNSGGFHHLPLKSPHDGQPVF